MGKKFTELKEKFKESPIQAYPRYGEEEAPFKVWLDFSLNTLGQILQRRQDGELRLIVAKGRKTTTGEQNCTDKGRIECGDTCLAYPRGHPLIQTFLDHDGLPVVKVDTINERSQGHIFPVADSYSCITLQYNMDLERKQE